MKEYQITPPGRDAAIRRLYKKGKKSMQEIGYLYGITRARVSQIIRKEKPEKVQGYRHK